MTDDGFSTTPAPPYWAVIFTSRRRGGPTPADEPGYARAAALMVQLAAEQPGFLGIESVRETGGLGITVSYWTDPDAIAAWRRHLEHTAVRETGRRDWYDHYELRVARVERAYAWDAPGQAQGAGADGTTGADAGGGNR